MAQLKDLLVTGPVRLIGSVNFNQRPKYNNENLALISEVTAAEERATGAANNAQTAANNAQARANAAYELAETKTTMREVEDKGYATQAEALGYANEVLGDDSDSATDCTVYGIRKAVINAQNTADNAKTTADGKVSKSGDELTGNLKFNTNTTTNYTHAIDAAFHKIKIKTQDINSANYNIIVQNGTGTDICHRTKNTFIQDLGLSQVYKYKGTKTWAQLKAITSATIGDVYSISGVDPEGNTNADWACLAAFSDHTTNDTETDPNYYGNFWSSLGGKVDLSPYAQKNASNIFDGEQRMINSSYCQTMYDIAAGIGCSLKNTRALDNQAIIGELLLPPSDNSGDGTANTSSVVANEMGVYIISDWGKLSSNPNHGKITGKTLIGKFTANGWEGNASRLSPITTSDVATSTTTQRRIWFSYNDNTTGRPAYSDNFTYQSSTGTVTASIFKGSLNGNADSATKATQDGDGNVIKDTYLKLAGGTMEGTAIITWPDSGNWGKPDHNASALPVKRGGLKWIGQSDWIELFSEESASDMLNLVAQFGDDSSSGIKVRNHSGIDVISLMANGNVAAAGTLTLEPASGEGGQILLNAATNDQTSNGIAIDTAWGDFRLFGLQPRDEKTTKTGIGSIFAFDPYEQKISIITETQGSSHFKYNTSDKCIDIIFN